MLAVELGAVILLPSAAGEVSPPYDDLPSPKRSRFGFAQAGGGGMVFRTAGVPPAQIHERAGRPRSGRS